MIKGNNMNIIFLDIDGVLNSLDYFIKIRDNKLFENDNSFESMQNRQIDNDKVELLKYLSYYTGSFIVITSSWKSLGKYKLVKKDFIKRGLPIIGETKDINCNRGTGIKNYIKEHNISNYIILDDDIFEDYDEELLSHLVKTSFMNGGLQDEHIYKGIKLLKRNK